MSKPISEAKDEVITVARHSEAVYDVMIAARISPLPGARLSP